MIAGRYTLEREIGRGGAGVVHLARDEVLGRSVAIKRMGLLPGTTGQDIARAEREARLAAGINHPHVVAILDLVKDDDCYWLVMEHVEGRTLSEVIRSEGPLPVGRAAALIAQAADALVEAGSAGIVHRDVKPGNIMVTASDHAKLADFGIARMASDVALTQTGLVTGSPAYLAPEVASGQPATSASDVWSLGASLYHAVVGRPPYEVGDNVLGSLYKIVNDPPPQLPSDHPAAGLLGHMLVKDPGRRWPVARVRDELRRIAGGERSTAGHAVDHGGEATAVLSTPVAPSSEPGSDTASFPAAPRARPVAQHSPAPVVPRPRSRPVGIIAGLVVLVVAVGLGAWWLRPGDGERPGPTGGSEQTKASPSGQASTSSEPSETPTETTQEPSASPAPPATGAAAQRAAMGAFVEDYFAAVTSDPRSTFELLTPQFKAESGGYDGYSGFWSTISSARPYDITADPKTLTVAYTIDYVTTSGRRTTQQVRLQLEQRGDTYLIAGEY